MLQDCWTAYFTGDYKRTLQTCADALCKSSGLDELHIAGLSLMHMFGRREDAVIMLRAAALFFPTAPHIYANAALVCEQYGRVDDCIWFVDIGLRFFPDNTDLLLLRANAHMTNREFEEARALYQRILRLDPKNVQALVNLGNIARSFEDFEGAEKFFARVHRIEPNFRDMVLARATLLSQQHKVVEAKALLETLPETDLDARFLLALSCMQLGEYERGFSLYQDRHGSIFHKQIKSYPFRPMDHWEEARDKSVVLIQEGGLGDAIMFCRYLPALADIATVTYYVPQTLVRLFRVNLPGWMTIKANDDLPVVESDYVTGDESLPYHFRTTLETIPVGMPYLGVMGGSHVLPPSAHPRPRVGLCWGGGTQTTLNQRPYDARRSIALDRLAGLLKADVEWVSLQMEEREGDDRYDMLRPLQADFDMYDTAAVIAQLDLVISVDTSIVHLAAAMGKKVWLLSRYDCCWRWLNNRQDAPWYPGFVRVFGQTHYNDWSEPVAEIETALQEWLTREVS